MNLIPSERMKDVTRAISLVVFLAAANVMNASQSDVSREQTTNASQSETEEQKVATSEQPFVADRSDGPEREDSNWKPVRFLPDEFRISAVHEVATLQETLRPGVGISVMKWERDQFSQDVYVERDPLLHGGHVGQARVKWDTSERPILQLRLTDGGSNLFSNATHDAIDRRLAVIVEGQLHSVPLVRQQIKSGRVDITGMNTDDIDYLVEKGHLRALVDPDARFEWNDMHKIRLIGQASLIYSNDNRERLPGSELVSGQGKKASTIHEVARLLAREGGLNDATIWVSDGDSVGAGAGTALSTVLDDSRTTLHPLFAAQEVMAFDYATGLHTGLSSWTPIAWTRGLQDDGTWSENGVYGSAGGFIVFLGGNVAPYRDLTEDGGALRRLDGSRTSNILETLPPDARVVGSGPGTLQGSRGSEPR
ncbi:MAG: hypothetical protein WD490_07020 [Opitutales bacterium]